MKNKKGIFFAIGVIALIIIFFDRIINFIVNIEWFSEVGYLSVYFTKLKAVFILLVPIFIVCFIAIWLYYISLRKNIVKKMNVIEINSNKKKIEKRIVFFVNIILSLLIASSISIGYWYRILQFTNAVPFNAKDPIFNFDISFFVFKLPLIESIYGALMSLLVLLIVITLVTYFIFNTKDMIGNRKTANEESTVKNFKSNISRFAGKQLAVISALILLVMSAGYVIKALELVYSPRGVVVGAGYTDINVTLLFYKILVVVCIIASIVIFISVIASKLKPIIVSVSAIIVLIIIEAVSAGVVQNLIVKSNEKALEQKYITYNIDATRKAFNIENVESNNFNIQNNLSQTDIKDNKDTIDNIKINSFEPALEYYKQTQVFKYYYNFNDIDVDRYNINGKYAQTFIAPREVNINTLEGNAATWQNKHLVFTHGYGVVMSKVNAVTSQGQPDFVINDIPPVNTSDIKLTNPRIYFGEETNDYAIVDTKMGECDYPEGQGFKSNKYEGKSGIKMSLLNKVLFAISERNIKMLLSTDITSSSKILINRNIMDRVQKIAPFLTYDKDPYVIIADGKLYWIIDAYTTSDKYPYSQVDETTGVNYIRNSVKVVVDASDGSTNFYIADKNDPIIKSYSKIFPNLFKDVSAVPDEIKQHFRYPQDIFNIQCNMLGKYHVTDPGIFYNGEDLWEVSENQKTVESEKAANEPSYAAMKLTGSDTEETVLLQYFNMKSKLNMVALFGARMDNDNYGKMILYRFPADNLADSPLLFKRKINQDPNISKEISLWNGNGSQIVYGDTMIIPIKSSLLYIEPVYLRATGENSVPEMKRVIVSYS
ncbi:MAG: UPF0182 family protein, partial [Bacillota bacterium]|nr:UPF0182 family protein [Bacillota bacterium]